jgi:hypothetical protein
MLAGPLPASMYDPRKRNEVIAVLAGQNRVSANVVNIESGSTADGRCAEVEGIFGCDCILMSARGPDRVKMELKEHLQILVASLSSTRVIVVPKLIRLSDGSNPPPPLNPGLS